MSPPARSWLSAAEFATLLLGLVAFALLSALLPPGQSPDEPNHLYHAYALSDGHLLPRTAPGSKTGGEVDVALIELDRVFPHHMTADRTGDGYARLQDLRWSGRTTYVEYPNTSYYFPAVYAPQALALRIGRSAQWSILASYQLARALAFATCLGLLLLAWRAWPVPLPALVILCLPMTMAQAVSPTIDGVTTALAVFALSLFMRLWHTRAPHGHAPATRASGQGAFVALGVALFVLVGSRANLLPLLALPLLLLGRQPTRRVLLATAVATVAALAWTVAMVVMVKDGGVSHPDHTQMQVLLHYVTHPGDVVRALARTLQDAGTRRGYAHGYVGILGFLDTPVPWATVVFFGWVLAATAVVSLDLPGLRQAPLRNAGLAGIAMAAVLLTFAALLVQWSTFPASFIDGVQGRYFTIPSLVLAYVFTRGDGWRTGVGRGLLAAALLTGAMVTAITLRERFYSPTHPVVSPATPPSADKTVVWLKPGAQARGRIAVSREGYVYRFSIVVGTNGGQSDGVLALRICRGEDCTTAERTLRESADNQYFDLALSQPLEVNADGELVYVLQLKNATMPVALWSYPLAANGHPADSMQVDDVPDAAWQPMLKLGLARRLSMH